MADTEIRVEDHREPDGDEAPAVEVAEAPDLAPLADAAEVSADAAVEVARIEADRDVRVAEVHAETDQAAIAAAAEAHAESEEWRTQIADLREDLATTKTAVQLILSQLTPPEPAPPSPPPESASESEFSAPEPSPPLEPEAAAPESPPEPPPRPKLRRAKWI